MASLKIISIINEIGDKVEEGTATPEMICDAYKAIHDAQLNFLSTGDNRLVNALGDRYRDFDNYDIGDKDLYEKYEDKTLNLLRVCKKEGIKVK